MNVKYVFATAALFSAANIGHTFDNQKSEFRGYSNSDIYIYTTKEEQTPLRGVYAERDAANDKKQSARLGAFNITGRASAKLTHDDNIYATQNNEESDTILTIVPFIEATSDWSRHQLGASAYLQSDTYSNNGDEDTVDYGGRVKGRLDIKRGINISGQAFAEQRHEDRGNPNTNATSVEPTEYTRRGGKLTATYAPSRVSLQGTLSTEARSYEDGITSTSAIIDNGDRDRTEIVTGIRAGYELKPGYEAFAKVDYVNTEYDEVDTAVGDKRSSNGYDAVVGLSSNLGSKMSGEIYAGVSEREYDAANLGDISEPTFGGHLLYRATDLTSVQVGLNRSIEETTLSTASGFVQTSINGRLEHALRRNVLIGADLTLAKNTYEGGSSNREDDVRQAGIDARYEFNEDVSASIGYEFTERDSNAANSDYTRGRFMTRLMGQF